MQKMTGGCANGGAWALHLISDTDAQIQTAE